MWIQSATSIPEDRNAHQVKPGQNCLLGSFFRVARKRLVNGAPQLLKLLLKKPSSTLILLQKSSRGQKTGPSTELSAPSKESEFLINPEKLHGPSAVLRSFVAKLSLNLCLTYSSSLLFRKSQTQIQRP